MNKVRFILKSGRSVVVFCENAKIKTIENELTSYVLEGIKGDRPLYFRIGEIVAVIDEGPVKEAAKNGA